MLIEVATGRSVVPGDEWATRSGDHFVVLRFETISSPGGNVPRAVLRRVDSDEVVMHDPSRMTVDLGWRLVARRGRVFQ